MQVKWSVKQIRPGRWHVVDPNGFPMYNNEPFGKDRPAVFSDYEVAEEVCEELNAACD
jgi:hypothetical protein